MRTKRRNIRAKVLAKLGNRCACCGETTVEFLCLDHVQNDGNKERRSLTGGTNHGGSHRCYQKAWALGCPPERYQLLCANCNHGKQLCGVCPHKKGMA